MSSYAHTTRRHRYASRRASSVSQTPPLPSSVTNVDYWHGELGASAANAVGQIAATTLPGQNTPTVGVDTGFFNNRTVYQATASGNRCWLVGLGFNLIGAGTRPWMYVIGRHRTASPAALQELAAIGRSGFANECNIGLTAANNRRGLLGASTVNNGTGDTNVHRFEGWKDGTNANFRVDGSNATTADASTLINAVRGIAIGSNSGSVADVGDVSVAFMLLCLAKPTEGEIAALNTWAQAYWGAP